MITAVLDTNVIVSGIVAFHKPTPPAQILKAWRAGKFQLIVSSHVLDELKSTLEKPYFAQRITPQQVARTITLFKEEAIVTPITTTLQGVATHPEDDLTLATAVSANADYLVTGDQPMLRKVGNTYQGVNLIAPIAFLKMLHKSTRE